MLQTLHSSVHFIAPSDNCKSAQYVIKAELPIGRDPVDIINFLSNAGVEFTIESVGDTVSKTNSVKNIADKVDVVVNSFMLEYYAHWRDVTDPDFLTFALADATVKFMNEMDFLQRYADSLLDKESMAELSVLLDKQMAGRDINQVAETAHYNFNYQPPQTILGIEPIYITIDSKNTQFGEDSYDWGLSIRHRFITEDGTIVPMSGIIDSERKITLPNDLLAKMAVATPLQLNHVSGSNTGIIGALHMSVYTDSGYGLSNGEFLLYHSQADKNLLLYAANTGLISKVFELLGRSGVPLEHRSVDSLLKYCSNTASFADTYAHLNLITDTITDEYGRFESNNVSDAAVYLERINSGNNEHFFGLFDSNLNPAIAKAMIGLTCCQNAGQLMFDIACMFK